jgi:3-oxoacyl-[acyl-carrier-protein] synthase I
MSTQTPVCIGWGAVTPLGPSVRHTGFYLRAGRSNFASSLFVDSLGDAVILASVTTLARDLQGAPRLVSLAKAAIDEALSGLDATLGRARIRVCLALPSRYCEDAKKVRVSAEGKQVIEALSAHPLCGDPAAEVHPFPQGVAAGAPALARAIELLHAHPADVVLVCGVDSYYAAEVLAQLERRDRLMTSDNLDALRPGEAAACLVLAGPRSRLARARGVCSLLAVGVGQEPTAGDDTRHSMAVGLSEALRAAVAPLRMEKLRCNWFWTDVTHESRKVRELQILFARFGDVMGFDMRLKMAGQELGEVGAASLPLFAALSAEAWFRGYAADESAVCFAASAVGLCGALLLRQHRDVGKS